MFIKLPLNVYGNNCFRFVCDIHFSIYVVIHGRSPHLNDDLSRGDKSPRWHQYLISCANFEAPEGKIEGIGA